MKDTMDKIVETYFRSVSIEPFTYKNREYNPVTLRVSQDIIRGIVCPENCAGCCTKFSLDYISNPSIERCKERSILFNNEEHIIYSDLQQGNNSNRCQHVMKNGRCDIHGEHPFSCDFELLRFSVSEKNKTAYLTTRLYGRGWNMLRIDEKRGALCEITKASLKEIPEVTRKLNLLKEWTDHFKLKTCIPDILNWLETRNVLNFPLIIRKG